MISYENGFEEIVWLDEKVDHKYYINRVLKRHVIKYDEFKNMTLHHPKGYFQ